MVNALEVNRVADMVADMEVDKVADMMVDEVADTGADMVDDMKVYKVADMVGDGVLQRWDDGGNSISQVVTLSDISLAPLSVTLLKRTHRKPYYYTPDRF